MTQPTALLSKLQIKAGAKLWLINVPRALAEEISAGAEVEIVHEADGYDGVLAFLGRLRRCRRSCREYSRKCRTMVCSGWLIARGHKPKRLA